MHRLMLTLSIATAGLYAASPLLGQKIDDRRGFWLAGAVTYSSTAINCSEYCPTERTPGLSGYLQFGGTPSRMTLAGAEVNGWYSSNSEAKREYIAVMGVGYLYLSDDYPFYIKLGVGAGRFGEEAGDDDLSASGFALQVGTGYDFRLTSRIWAAPLIQYLVAPDMNAKRNRFGLSQEFDMNLLQVGAKISWH